MSNPPMPPPASGSSHAGMPGSGSALRNDVDIQNILQGTLLMGIVGMIPVASNCLGTGCSGVMAGFACFAVGAIIGLLFGIPRSLQGSGPSRNSTSGGSDGQDYGDNSNLEQISDWLTKILIGASLVQMREIKGLLVKLAERLAGVDQAKPGFAFALFVIVYFLSLGFVSSYLLSRIYLPAVLKRAKDAASRVEQLAQAANEKSDQAIAEVKAAGEKAIRAAESALRASEEATQARNLALGVASREMAVDARPLPSEALSPNAFQGASEDDPNKGKFGGQAETNQCRLSAQVKPIPGGSDYFIVHLEVRRTDETPLAEAVTFHLHPTFQEPTVTRTPVEGIAALDLMCWGAFTVGATTDGGKTRLELDLATLSEAPKEFTSR